MIQPTVQKLRAASDMLELIRTMTTSKGLAETLEAATAEREVLDQREADIQAREAAIDTRIAEIEALEELSNQNRKKADELLAAAQKANEDAAIVAADLDKERGRIAGRDVELSVRSDELASDQRKLALKLKALDDREAKMLEAEAALAEREAALAEREAKLRALIGG